jgi:hypothetical protein
MEYYIIIAFSFAIMYSIKYGWEIAKTVMDILFMFDVNYLEYNWHPVSYMIAVFLLSLIAMPFFIPLIFKKRYKVIKQASSHILINKFGFEKNDTEL